METDLMDAWDGGRRMCEEKDDSEEMSESTGITSGGEA